MTKNIITKEKLKAAVIGFGITGQSLSRFLVDRGYKVEIFDLRAEAEFELNLLKKFNQDDVRFNFSSNDFDESSFDLIAVSPGVSPNLPVLKRAISKKIPIHNDITLFIESWQDIGPIVGVTGSNGKSTVVSLLYYYLQKIGVNSLLAGNIGNSPLEELNKKYPKGTIVILELSSYQLDYFGPNHYVDVCLITNLSSNHLDRYDGNMQNYALAKMRGINSKKTKTILCFDDFGTKKYILPKFWGKELYLVSLETSVSEATQNGIYSGNNGDLFLKKDKEEKNVFDNAGNRNLIGLHNLYNIGFSIAVLDCLGINLNYPDIFRQFRGLEHRIEFVDEINGVRYINDSKSTSPDSTRVALESVATGKNVFLIMGGKDKGMDYNSLIPQIEQFVKKLAVLPGNSSQKIKKTFLDTGAEIIEVANLQDALKKLNKLAKNGDVILLSPGSASTGIYKNFEERGRHFKEIVSTLML